MICVCLRSYWYQRAVRRQLDDSIPGSACMPPRSPTLLTSSWLRLVNIPNTIFEFGTNSYGHMPSYVKRVSSMASTSMHKTTFNCEMHESDHTLLLTLPASNVPCFTTHLVAVQSSYADATRPLAASSNMPHALASSVIC